MPPEFESSDASIYRDTVPAFGGGAAEPAEVEKPTADAKEADAPVVAEKPDAKGKDAPSATVKTPADLPPIGDKPTAAKEEPKAETKEAEEPEAEEKSEPTEAERLATFKAEAEKLGYIIDPSGRVANRERAKFRAEKQQERASIQEERARMRSEFDGELRNIENQKAVVTRFYRAVEAGDFDEIAAAIGLKDWQTLQAEAVSQASDPAYKQLRELKRDKEAREQREAQQRAEYERQHAARQESEGLRAYHAELQKGMAESPEPMLKALHWDPILVSHITNEQRKEWKTHGVALSAEQVVRQNRGGVRDYMKRMYESLHTVFGSGTAPAAEDPAAKETPKAAAAAPSKPATPAKKPPVQVPNSGAVTPSSTKKVDPTSDEWFAQQAEMWQWKQKQA